MISLKRLLLAPAIACAAVVLFAVATPAQTDDAAALNKKVVQLYQAGKYAEAVPLAQKSLAIREKALGLDHPDVATSLNNLAELYKAQSRYADAEPLYERSVAIREKALGPDHPDVAGSLNNLAGLYDAQGRYADAELLYKRSLAIWEKALGPDHPTVAVALNNLAVLYDTQGRYAAAEPLYKRSLTIREKAFGPDHPNVSTVLNNLALLIKNQGRYAESEPLYKRALAIREKALGPNHPLVAQSLNNLALLYESEGRYAEVEPLLKRSLAIREKVHGPEHPEVATSLNNLAGLYIGQGRYADAEPLYMRSLTINEKALGRDHPSVALALNNMAMLYTKQGRYVEVESLYKRAMAIDEKALGPDNPLLATDLSNLASLYDELSRYADSEPLHKRALAIDEKSLGPNHPTVAKDLNNLAILYANQGRDADSLSLSKRSLAIYEKALGPDHPNVAQLLNNMAASYGKQRRYTEAEQFYKRALAIREKTFGPDHPDVAESLNIIAALYSNQKRYADALPLVRTTIVKNAATTTVALPVLFGAQSGNLLPESEALDDGLDVIQRASQTAVGRALNALAVRFSAGSDRLAELVRKDQDLATEADRLDQAIIAAVSQEPAKRDAAAEQRIRNRSAAVEKERSDLQNVFAKEFPDYAALSKPQPLTVKRIQALLADDEALVVVDLNNKSYVWVVTRSGADWKELNVTAAQVSNVVSKLRAMLEADGGQPFDPQLSFELYRQILGPVDATIQSKPRLSFVVDGALTSLPPQVLVASDPAGKALKNVDWLIRRHAITILPSVASLKVLRAKTVTAEATKPLIGFADPVFDRDALRQNVRVAANVTADRGLRGKVADVAELAADLPQLPESADELRRVAASVKASASDVILGPDATETRVKQTALDQYRIVYFATHALVAGEVAEFAKLNAEPALVLTLPEKPSDLDDGLLTASEVAQLKLNADWVVLSACNTAAGEKPGAEALGGLARAFFYAGGRSLLVSHWPVETNSAVMLMTGTFSAIAADAKLSHGEALRKAELAMIDDSAHPYLAEPKFWAPFVVVGEPKKQTQ